MSLRDQVVASFSDRPARLMAPCFLNIRFLGACLCVLCKHTLSRVVQSIRQCCKKLDRDIQATYATRIRVHKCNFSHTSCTLRYRNKTSLPKHASQKSLRHRQATESAMSARMSRRARCGKAAARTRRGAGQTVLHRKLGSWPTGPPPLTFTTC